MTDNEVNLKITATDGASTVLSSIAGGVTALGVAAAAAVAGGLYALADFTKSAVDDAMKLQVTQSQLNQVIKSTGDVSGITADAANQLATKMELLSGNTKQTELAGETFMLQFTNIGKNIFPQATQAANVLAARTGTDLTSAFQMVGRALNDPENGIGRLNTQFKLFDTTQDLTTILKIWRQNRGDVAGAQTEILNALSKACGVIRGSLWT